MPKGCSNDIFLGQEAVPRETAKVGCLMGFVVCQGWGAMALNQGSNLPALLEETRQQDCTKSATSGLVEHTQADATILLKGLGKLAP